ncbi:hypothetical protein ACKGJY_15435 [Hyunsoonleella sp. 2307UL5-6]|uniref:hypothetical protein n=1 Tax=Hyunsoonleella sp. 2307UL5-6 TaxID=3384768 RepID=UPI0039BD4ACD
MSTSILESKLKRHKISYSNENGKIVIGKPKTDYGTLIGLVALPIIGGIGICLLMILNNIEFIGANRGKIIAGIIFLFGTGFFNLSRIRAKKQSNDNLKTLDYKVIKVKNEFGEYTFDSKNIKDFEYSAEQIDEETYEGNLYLIDNEERRHQILGFDDENEKYVLNDLKWFSEYLMKHVELKITVANNV